YLGRRDVGFGEEGEERGLDSLGRPPRVWGANPRKAPPAAPAAALAQATATPAKPASTQNPDVGVSVVALVFDRLSQDSRKRAHDAAMSYVGGDSGLNSFVGVFAINLSVNTVQNYTTDI